MKIYKPTIGLEIHVELKTRTKMFCGCLNENEKIGSAKGLEPNKNVCPICLAHPGTMPAPNLEAIKSVIKAGLALNCEIAEKSKFDRKQYFYPDLPKGYQISQYDEPLCSRGFIEINGKKIGITRIHLEEDTGKLSHISDGTLVDFNRCGIPLMELVTEPDIESGAEAKEFCQEIQAIFRELEISDADMEKGQMRCEVNISLSKIKTPRPRPGEAEGGQLTELKNGKEPLGTKVEIKNLNSFRTVEKAIDFEIKRQMEILEKGEKVIQETRGFDDAKQITFSQRVKEGAADYRYFPEPDIPPLKLKMKNEKLKIDEEFIDIEKIKQELPEMPMQKRKRFIDEYGFTLADAKIITSVPKLADYAEQVISELRVWLIDSGQFEGTEEEIWNTNREKAIKLVAGWLINKLGGLLNARKLTLSDNTITAENFAEFIMMIFTHRVSSTNANKLLERMLETGGDPSHILEDENLGGEGDFDLNKLVEEIINKNPDIVAQFKAGKIALLKFFIGQAMKDSKGKADPKEVENLFLQKLSI
jgi:aspartyl-tRNA(Asn)/glutamyl-tRNA(Gln) amidotransferase subunit B